MPALAQIRLGKPFGSETLLEKAMLEADMRLRKIGSEVLDWAADPDLSLILMVVPEADDEVLRIIEDVLRAHKVPVAGTGFSEAAYARPEPLDTVIIAVAQRILGEKTSAAEHMGVPDVETAIAALASRLTGIKDPSLLRTYLALTLGRLIPLDKCREGVVASEKIRIPQPTGRGLHTDVVHSLAQAFTRVNRAVGFLADREGEVEPFSLERVIGSLVKAGVPEKTVFTILGELLGVLEGITVPTKEEVVGILSLLLDRHDPSKTLSARFSYYLRTRRHIFMETGEGGVEFGARVLRKVVEKQLRHLPLTPPAAVIDEVVERGYEVLRMMYTSSAWSFLQPGAARTGVPADTVAMVLREVLRSIVQEELLEAAEKGGLDRAVKRLASASRLLLETVPREADHRAAWTVFIRGANGVAQASAALWGVLPPKSPFQNFQLLSRATKNVGGVRHTAVRTFGRLSVRVFTRGPFPPNPREKEVMENARRLGIRLARAIEGG